VNVRVLAVAQRELDDAVVYYNQQQPGLGNAFLAETVAAIDRIRRFPRGWHPLGPELRRCLLRRFPYGVIYRVENEGVLIVALAHVHRRPEYWRTRI
jgi:plasmid stabilization system protein ParE